VPLNLSRPRTVLIVDDDEGHRTGLRSFLEKVGFEVVEAWSGRSAMAQVTSGHLPEMVITDLKMSDGSGYWFLEEMEREFPRLVRRTVVLSGDADHETAVRLSEDTGCPVVRKPFEAGQLLDILDQVAVQA
jgi:DNA-binding NtrC family response regulator